MQLMKSNAQMLESASANPARRSQCKLRAGCWGATHLYNWQERARIEKQRSVTRARMGAEKQLRAQDWVPAQQKATAKRRAVAPGARRKSAKGLERKGCGEEKSCGARRHTGERVGAGSLRGK